jgi:hypothetical protein
VTPVESKLECEACGIGFVVTYDADVPTRLLSIHCRCGHDTPIRQVPEPGITILAQQLPDGSIKLW